MEIALDGADDRGIRGSGAALRDQWLQDGQGRLHGVGGDEHLRHEDLVALEALADDGHARYQSLLDDGACFLAIVQTRLRQLDRSCLVAIDDGLRQRMHLVHDCDRPSITHSLDATVGGLVGQPPGPSGSMWMTCPVSPDR